MLLSGIFPALTTPFYPDGRIYYRKLEHNIVRYGTTPIAGVVVLGSTGESVMLSDEERRDVLKAAAAAASAELVLVAGTAAESVRETLAMTEHAAAAGYDIALIRTPHYYRAQMTPLAMLTYYRAVADRSPLPVLLYSVPPMTAYDLPVEVVAELADHPNIFGIKESSGSVEKVRELVARTRHVHRKVSVRNGGRALTRRAKTSVPASEGEFVAVSTIGTAPERTVEVGFQVLIGAAQKLLPSLEAGATGAVLAFADVAPCACAAIHRAWESGDRATAQVLQDDLSRAASRVASELGIPGIKHGMDFNGYYGGVCRLPLLPVDAATRLEIEDLLQNIRS